MRTINSFLPPALLLGVLLTVVVPAADAALDEDIARDLAPLDGYVVMKEGDEFIIDLDADRGIRPGDIFAVLGPAKDIVHPVSKKVLGKLESVKGILKVTRLAGGYSFARALEGAPGIERGDAIRRYALLPANFWDYSGAGRPMFVKLQQLLPALKWREYQKSQRQRPAEPEPSEATDGAMTFVYTGDEMVVRDPEFNELRRYSAAGPQAATPAPAGAVSAPAPAAAVQPSKTDAPVVEPEFKQVKTIANMPHMSLMADFLYLDATLWIASTNGLVIDIFTLDGQLKPVADARPSIQARVLALKWWMPKAAARPHLAVTAWRNKSVAGLIYRLENNRLIPVEDGLPLILGAFDVDADGLPETLLGQDFDGEEFFGQHIQRLELAGGGIRSESFGMKLPRRFPVIGSLIADLTGDGSLENAFIRNGNLYIFNGRKRLYKSVKKMGGSLSFLTYDVDPSFEQEPKTTTAAFEVAPLAVDLDGDGRRELAAVASERSVIGSLGIAPGVNQSWINVFKFAEGRFSSGNLGEKFDLALQGISLSRERLLLVGTEPGDIMDQEQGSSYVLGYSLTR